MKTNLIIFGLIILAIQTTEASSTCPASFEESLNQQLTALDNRDLAAYMGAIPPRKEQLMILPDGNAWTTRHDIENGHREWFKDATWKFNRELKRKDVRDNWGLAVYRVSVDRPSADGDPFLLSMMFAPEKNGCWYLQHDQNTLLPKTTVKQK